MAEKSGSERRQDFTVDRRVRRFYLTTFIFSLLLVASFMVFTYLLWSASTPLALGGTSIYFLMGGVAFVIILCALLQGVYTIVHTHRMMGSAYRIGQYLHELNEGGSPAPLTLRENDFFLEVADQVNVIRAAATASNDKGTGASPSDPAPEASENQG